MYNLTKRFLTAVLCLVLFSSVKMHADSNWRGRVSFDPVLVGFKGGGASFGFRFGAYNKVHDNLELGFGTGIAESWNFKAKPAIPIFIGARYDNFNPSFSPIFDFETGIDLSCAKIDYSAFFINPMFGIRLNNFSIGFGYFGEVTLKSDFGSEWVSGVNLRVAYYFGFHKRDNSSFKNSMRKIWEPVSDFFKPVEVVLDLRTQFPVANNANEGNIMNEDVTFGLDFTFFYPIAKNLKLGPTIGVHATTDGALIPLAVSTRYDIKQLKITDKLYPWAQFDLGMNIGCDDYKSSFLYRPAVGLTYEVRDGKSALELGVGFHTNEVKDRSYNNDDFTRSYLDISLGYRF